MIAEKAVADTSGVTVEGIVERADGNPIIEFGRDMIEPPFIIRLLRDGRSLQIVANGLGSFELVEPR